MRSCADLDFDRFRGFNVTNFDRQAWPIGYFLNKCTICHRHGCRFVTVWAWPRAIVKQYSTGCQNATWPPSPNQHRFGHIICSNKQSYRSSSKNWLGLASVVEVMWVLIISSCNPATLLASHCYWHHQLQIQIVILNCILNRNPPFPSAGIAKPTSQTVVAAPPFAIDGSQALNSPEVRKHSGPRVKIQN